MSEFKVGDKVVWIDKEYAKDWFPETVDEVLTLSKIEDEEYVSCKEFVNGEFVLAKRFKKYNEQDNQMKIHVLTDKYEYMGLKKGEVVDGRFYPEQGEFVFLLNGKSWTLAKNEAEEVVIVKDQPTTKVKSNGGSSDYYKLTITNKKGETFECETGDIIRCMIGNDFSLGNCLKALRRMYLDSIGGGKKGVDLEYDGNKVKYFTDEFVHFNKKEKQNEI